MNTYFVTGHFRSWDENQKDVTAPISRVVLAASVTEVVALVEHRYRDAVIDSVLLRDRDVLREGSL